MPNTTLPNKADFVFWDDQTSYSRSYHVDQRHPDADDNNDGNTDRPLKTIAAASALVQAGEEVVIHAGVYEETIRPERGGKGPDAMLTYRAAGDGPVVISASDRWHPEQVEDAGGWNRFPAQYMKDRRIWVAPLPLDAFGGYNPFLAVNLSRSDWFPWTKRPAAERRRAQARRGTIYQDGRPLQQVHHASEVMVEPGRFWVFDNGDQVIVRLFEDADPAVANLHISCRAACIDPVHHDTGYIRISGLHLRHAANGVPFPQHGALSTRCGHHWIIEHNQISDCNTVGMDIGYQVNVHPNIPKDGKGAHIVRDNHISNCGLCGICGSDGIDNSLIEHNLIEDIGDLDLEHVYEAAGIKLHWARQVLIRNNHIRRTRHACGIWMDYQCENNRLSGNCIHDIQTVLAGIYIEANHLPHLIDGNIIWNTRDEPENDPPKDGIPGGMGISVDVSDEGWACNNLLGAIQGHYAIACHLAQADRQSGPRSALCRGMRMHDNIVLNRTARVLFARLNDNQCDGNAYAGQGRGCFGVHEADRQPRFDMVTWQQHFGFDQNGAEVDWSGDWDGDAAAVCLTVDEARAAESDLAREAGYDLCGPFDSGQWQMLRDGKYVKMGVGPRLG